MSVNHNLLSIDDPSLVRILKSPQRMRNFVDAHTARICFVGKEGVAIASLTAASEKDPLAFLIEPCLSKNLSGWVGEYSEGPEGSCEVDMGYGPARYFRSAFVKQIAINLKPISITQFTRCCDMELLEREGIYPMGWTKRGRKMSLIETFNRYRKYLLQTSDNRQNMLMWCS